MKSEPRMIRVVIFLAIACMSAGASAQTKSALNNSAKELIGTWEFSNAERDKICTATFKSDSSPVGYTVTFDPNCANLFPLVRDIAGWKYPEDDLLYLLDAQGKSLVEFSEVEDGIFEAPTPGVGVLMLQKPAAADEAPQAEQPDKLAGNWTIARGNGGPLCNLTLAATATGGGFALTVLPGCAKSIEQLNFTQWQLDNGELVLVPSRGSPWRFEEADSVTWHRIPETAAEIMLVRQQTQSKP
jgi:Protease inhibitor Inh